MEITKADRIKIFAERESHKRQGFRSWTELEPNERIERMIKSGNKRLIELTELIIEYNHEKFVPKGLWFYHERKRGVACQHMNSQMQCYTNALRLLVQAGILKNSKASRSHRYRLLVPMSEIVRINKEAKKHVKNGYKTYGNRTSKD